MTPERRLRVRDVDFDALPDAVRAHFCACVDGRAEPRPLARDLARPSQVGDVAIALLGAAIAAVTAIRGFGESSQGAAARGLYALGALLVATGVLAILHRRAARSALPFAPGRYLFPLAFVDARSKRLEVARLEGDVRVEARDQDDRAIVDVLIGARRESFAVDRAAASAATQAIRSAQGRTSADDGDAPRADGDPLVERAEASATTAPVARAAPIPRWLEPGPRGVIAAAFAVVVSTALFEVRNRVSDEQVSAAPIASASRSTDEPARKLASAARADDALARFRARASTDDPRLVPVMERLVAALRRRGDPRVALAFRPPTRAVLDAVDAILAERAGPGFPVVKVAPHFGAEQTKKHEPAAALGIAAAFADAFPTDVLRVEPGEAAEGAPSIDVGYIVGWAGDAVVDEVGHRRFVSVVVDFDVTIDVPGEAAYKIHFRVPPPDDLEVKVDADADAATEAQVYDAMATHAFSRVGPELRNALLKP